MSASTRSPALARGRRLAGLLAVAVVSLAGCAQAQDESATPAGTGLDFEFYRDNVEPVFTRSRGDFVPPDPGDPACVMCHTWQTSTPLHLESLEADADGGVFWTEEQSRRNFEVVSRLVTPGDPENSRLLRMPLVAREGGTDYHTGGKVWGSRDDPEWQALAEWVRTGTSAGAPVTTSPDVDFEFFQACVQPILMDATPGGLACANCHVGGADGFARALPEGRVFWNEEESRQNFRIAMRFIEPGQPTQSRLLMHPLHPDGGGDYAHNGVRRWMSQDDPEWQMLAAWVQGDRTGTNCRH